MRSDRLIDRASLVAAAGLVRSFTCVLVAAALLTCKSTRANDAPATAADHRVLPVGQLPEDQRLGPLKTLDGYFPFEPPASTAQWHERAAEVRRRILVAAGLWPLPDRHRPQAVVHGLVDRPKYTVERVFIESVPGHYVTGNLYRPKSAAGQRPAVLCPHGHWPQGRLQDQGLEEVRRQIVQGAERFETTGRYPIQARCVQLARMGCLVFAYDMLGYGDSQQISQAVAHGIRGPRLEFDTATDWGFFSAQAELRLQNPFGLQTLNSLYALDWVAGLPDVDATRIAVVGASGGGTQTMMLCGIDPRPAVSFPAVMVSTAMQGGCTCENASCLRVGTGNIEIAALFAPKPLGMTAADDWTRELATKGFPELRQLYALFDARDKVGLTALTHFPHNFNYVSRAAMYAWLNRHLDLGWTEPIVEEEFHTLTAGEMHVWNDQHPAPPGGPNYERQLLRTMTQLSEAQFAALAPRDEVSLRRFQEVVRSALRDIVNRDVPSPAEVSLKTVSRRELADYLELHELASYRPENEQLPVVRLVPRSVNGDIVLWLQSAGKQGLFGPSGDPVPEVQRLLEHGIAVVGADLFYQGEFLKEGQPLDSARIVDNDRPVPVYTFGYNRSLFAQRVCDVLTLVAALETLKPAPGRVHLIGAEGAGPWAATAGALAGGAVSSVAIDSGGFRFANLESWQDVDFLPGAVKYGDLPGMLALVAPTPLIIAGEGDQSIPLVEAAYSAAGARSHLVTASASTNNAQGEIVDLWLRHVAGDQ